MSGLSKSIGATILIAHSNGPLFSPSLDDLKLAEFVPMYKNNNPLDKENYRPVTLLSHVLRFLKIKKFIQDIIHAIYHLTCIMDIISQLLFCSY